MKGSKRQIERVEHDPPTHKEEPEVISTGQTIENPVTGERITFHKTSRDTGGEYVLVETILQPDAFVAAAHSHPYQSESFQVLEGRVGFKLGRKKVELGPGDAVTVLPRTAHKFWNAGDGTARFTCEIRPAGAFEQLIETMVGLPADGKTSKKGMPNPLRLAVIARHHFDDVRLPSPPAWLQKLGLIAGAPTGRLLGYKPTYAQDEIGEVALT